MGRKKFFRTKRDQFGNKVFDENYIADSWDRDKEQGMFFSASIDNAPEEMSRGIVSNMSGKMSRKLKSTYASLGNKSGMGGVAVGACANPEVFTTEQDYSTLRNVAGMGPVDSIFNEKFFEEPDIESFEDPIPGTNTSKFKQRIIELKTSGLLEQPQLTGNQLDNWNASFEDRVRGHRLFPMSELKRILRTGQFRDKDGKIVLVDFDNNEIMGEYWVDNIMTGDFDKSATHGILNFIQR